VDIEGPCRGNAGPIEVKRTAKWTETTFGEGISCFYCHVKIPTTYDHLLPRREAEEPEGLRDTWDEEYSPTTSRLACQITLDQRHDGMVVFVPDAPPMDMC
jgi:ferredoxin